VSVKRVGVFNQRRSLKMTELTGMIFAVRVPFFGFGAEGSGASLPCNAAYGLGWRVVLWFVVAGRFNGAGFACNP
jgi:hypothetical protein